MAQEFPKELIYRYDKAEFVGSGGFGSVYKVQRKDNGKVVAVKIPLRPDDEETGKSFLREITSWRLLNHKNIVSLIDANIVPIIYLEQEYIDGGNLDKLKKPLDISEACDIVFDVAEGLSHAHKQKIIHRDLKPKNILLTKEHIPKITDWGMSKIIMEGRSSTMKGFSYGYQSPEQISPKKFGKTDERTDIYQLGVIFYNLITNELPFKGDDLVEINSAIISNEPVDPSIINPKADKVNYIVLKCLSKNKENRYQTADELLHELEKFVGNRLGSTAEAKYRVENIVLSNTSVAPNESVQVSVDIVNIVSEKVLIPISLLFDKKQIDNTTVELEGHSSHHVVFSLSSDVIGNHTIQILPSCNNAICLNLSAVLNICEKEVESMIVYNYCINCGIPNEKKLNYCVKCGINLSIKIDANK